MKDEIKVKIESYKIAPRRYLHQVEVPRGYFYVITDHYFFSTSSLIISNKVRRKKDPIMTRGRMLVGKEREGELQEDGWKILCFGGMDNIKLRKIIYGKELGTVKLEMLIFRDGRVSYIRNGDGKDLIPRGIIVILNRNLRKRIKDPLPYITMPQELPDRINIIYDKKDRPVKYEFIVSELSFIKFVQKIKEWYG